MSGAAGHRLGIAGGWTGLALLVLLVTAALPAAPAGAQVSPTVMDQGVESTFPEGMVFRVSAQSDSTIDRVRLRYTILPDGTAASGEADLMPGKSVSARFELKGNDPPRIYLPPGTIIEYYWEVTDADGDLGRSEQATVFYDDDRFQWTKLEEGGVVLYYYSGSEGDARAMLAEASVALASMSELMGAGIGFPVKVWIYDSVEDMRPALARRSETYEQSIITAGIRVASDTVLVLGNASFDTLRHELTHVVTAVAGEGPFGTLPAWLDEGTAVYGQGDPGGFGDALQRAVDRGNVLSVRSITSYPGDPNKVDLFYGQSWSLVSYLIEAYGEEKFAQLFAEIKGGKRIGDALTAAYGFDQDGLEDEWRASLGLPPRQTSAPPPEEEMSTPTVAPSGDLGPAPEEDGGTSAGVVVGLAVGTLALAAVVGFAGWAVSRRFR